MHQRGTAKDPNLSAVSAQTVPSSRLLQSTTVRVLTHDPCVDPCVDPCFGIGLSLSLICQLTSEDIKQHHLPTYLFQARLLGFEIVSL